MKKLGKDHLLFSHDRMMKREGRKEEEGKWQGGVEMEGIGMGGKERERQNFQFKITLSHRKKKTTLMGCRYR